ncbi:dimethyl sulfoxide reductase subunit A [Shewanella colwelliana]|uniref:Dimethyl sulfoxide reductase subunit A n=1 Tax=Shewanella colwelliana TaxID=23 RepID=A0ABQ4P4M8_SHECO|nr:DMSO/selenate family reductase complex A subunit [Shewanella colwelliana]MDX1280712.1 DMSO/selenate family reductase complex A subunit [Shewanella colwelliana]GIU19551.1 dimethyl sulfoxide reductase subunit A [Shewanella colwelliana]GIU42440.1 dimethyl sulfoxide reductase subunit A [Shewanella colwelliana]
MERRSFLKMSAALGCAATVTGCNSSSDDANVIPPQPPVTDEVVNWSSCLVNCGSNCPIKVFTKDGIVTRVETDHEVEDNYGLHQVRACARGRSLRQRNYAVDRLKTPMKRVGERGKAEFVPISWDEATSIIAEKLSAVYAQENGAKSVFRSYGSGAYYGFASNACFNRLFNLNGGCLNAYGNYSWAQQMEAAKHTFGTGSTAGSSTITIEDSDFFLGVAYNPSEIRQSGSGEGYDYLQALQRNNGLEVVMIDPRYTDSMLGKESSWLPIRPGTDAAFAEAVAHEMINHANFAAQSLPFVLEHSVGFTKQSIEDQKSIFETSGDPTKQEYAKVMNSDENYQDFILGQGIYTEAKTPEWAEKICGIPAAKIRYIADKLMTAKAPYIVVGAGVNRQANGEQNMRALYMLSVLTGKLGVRGASNGELPSMSSMSRAGIPTGSNPVKESISFFTWSEAIQHGETMTARSHGIRGTDGLDTPLGANIKFILSASDSSLLNQHAEINNTAKILREAEDLFVVSCDCWMTPGAKFADIILPDTSWLESNDLVNDSYASGSLGYLTAMSSSVETMWDCKSMYEAAAMIADKMGVGAGFRAGKTEDQWLEELYQSTKANSNNIDVTPAFPATYKEAQKIGFFRKNMNDNHVALESFVKEGKALSTPSGKIEIYSAELAWRAANWDQESSAQNPTGVKGDTITAIPQYTVTWDGYEDEDAKEDYPIQLAGYHTKGRTHSSYHNVPWLREAVEDAVWVNPMDGAKHGLSSGDKIEMYNDRGSVEVTVRITPRVAPGVFALGQGAWYNPGNKRSSTGHIVDEGGAINSLTRYQPSPVAKGNPQHTIRVAIKKI